MCDFKTEIFYLRNYLIEENLLLPPCFRLQSSTLSGTSWYDLSSVEVGLQVSKNAIQIDYHRYP